ncbi:hypothetical protein TD95_000147 [Thielaviopsis punctulata]|uniref:SAC domain-containing protein n=1 Tax=Thielaviopsis punctulata TaxID=72032 RepID=A0A0F4Z7G7_9PEZI|nr:hypothetical protein TD95_000147 [Thielaviopsis punctulata]
MAGLARKLTISATADGLVIQPLTSKGQRSSAPLKIRYGEAAVSASSSSGLLSPTTVEAAIARPVASFEAFGIVGLITVSKLSFLITITRREVVAQISGSPVYVVSEVAITPCSSQRDAEEAIEKTIKHLARNRGQAAADSDANADSDSDSDSSDSEIDEPPVPDDDVDDSAPREYDASTVAASPAKPSSIAENVISKRGSYGRFAQSWFSKAGWMLEHKRSMGLSEDGRNASNKAASIAESEDYDEGLIYGDTPPPLPSATPTPALLPKLIRTLRVYFGTSRSFYFSYDYDITRSWQAKQAVPPNAATQPLYRRVDETYFWNRHMVQPFIDGGDESFILPLMQGFVGQTSFVVDSCPPQKDTDAPLEAVEMAMLSAEGSLSSSPSAGSAGERKKETERKSETEKKNETGTEAEQKLRPTETAFLLTLISRRSTRRAGLRYLRRGIDDEGNVANNVETEQVLSSVDWAPERPVYSFVQIRGSIPVFFTQTAYSLKPIPVLQHSPEANYAAFTKHFDRLARMYGKLQVVNLVEKKGIEKNIGETYQRYVAQRNEEVATSEGTDSSTATDSSKEKATDNTIPFEWFDFHHACRGMKFENVSQLLEKLRGQLEAFGSSVTRNGILTKRQTGVLRTNCMDCLDRTNVCQSSFAKHMLEQQLKELGFDMSAQLDQQTAWFNTLWADNGDAVSNQYASTAAMKGDYTRFRKRDYRGTLNDIGLSLTRFYNGMVNDYFSQAAIDFVLGNVTSMVFDEFEANMMTKDPAVSMSRVRDQAIEQCQKRVVANEQEEFIGGWVLLSPQNSDSLRSEPLQEVVLLLTDAALYLCRYDWSLDKVSSFERIDLSHITSIKAGVYITSTLTALYMDEQRNVGFVVAYQPGKEDFIRTNTRTLSTLGEAGPVSGESGVSESTTAGVLPSAETDVSVSVETGASAKTTISTLTEPQSVPIPSGLTSPRSIPLPPSPLSSPSLAANIPSSLAELLSGNSKSRAPQKRIVAFKAPYMTSSLASNADEAGGTASPLTEMQKVDAICAEIERLVMMHMPREAGEMPTGMVERADVISLEEAKKSTGLFDTLGYAIKKMVWAS